MIKLWVDDVREAPKGYKAIRSVYEARIYCSQHYFNGSLHIDEISLDHDAGDFACSGGDYIQLLNWLEEKQEIEGWDLSQVTFKFHSQNPVGIENMKRICKKNNWRTK